VEEDLQGARPTSQTKSVLLEANSPLWPSLVDPAIIADAANEAAASAPLPQPMSGISMHQLTAFQRLTSHSKVRAPSSFRALGTPTMNSGQGSTTPPQTFVTDTNVSARPSDMAKVSGQRFGGSKSRLSKQVATDALQGGSVPRQDGADLSEAEAFSPGPAPPVQTYDTWTGYPTPIGGLPLTDCFQACCSSKLHSYTSADQPTL
jgi:hypothetical protein